MLNVTRQANRQRRRWRRHQRQNVVCTQSARVTKCCALAASLSDGHFWPAASNFRARLKPTFIQKISPPIDRTRERQSTRGQFAACRALAYGRWRCKSFCFACEMRAAAAASLRLASSGVPHAHRIASGRTRRVARKSRTLSADASGRAACARLVAARARATSRRPTINERASEIVCSTKTRWPKINSRRRQEVAIKSLEKNLALFLDDERALLAAEFQRERHLKSRALSAQKTRRIFLAAHLIYFRTRFREDITTKKTLLNTPIHFLSVERWKKKVLRATRRRRTVVCSARCLQATLKNRNRAVELRPSSCVFS